MPRTMSHTLQARIHTRGRGLSTHWQISLIALLVCALLAGLPALSRAEAYPPVLKPYLNNGLKVTKRFAAASGLTGWVVLHQGQHTVLFTTADGKTLISGALIDEQGKNLTASYARRYIPKPDFSQVFSELETSHYITEGTLKAPKKIIYIFTDANCPFCHKTWLSLQPYEKAGLQVRWVMVAVLGPNSMNKAIEVMASKDRLAAFRTDMEHFGSGRAVAAGMTPQAKPAEADIMRQQTALMTRFGIQGTPGLVWKNAAGKVMIKFGMPLPSEIPGITGLPRQTTTPLSLSRHE